MKEYCNMSNEVQKRAVNLFKYIKSVLESNLKVQTDFNNLQFKKFENAFNENKYISSFFNHPEQKEFFILKYPNIEEPPKYPDSLNGWLMDYPSNPKLLCARYNEDESSEQNIKREDIWKEFKPQFDEWKSRNKQKLEIENLFRQLYTLSMSKDENYELVLGHGILAWETFKKVGSQVKKTVINYPLVTIELTITYDPKTKKILMEPVDDKTYQLEDLMLQEYIPDLTKTKELFSELEYDITQKDSYIGFFENILNQFINPNDKTLVNGKLVEDKQIDPTKPTSELRLFDTWGIFYRKRRQNAELLDLENYINILESKNNCLDSSLTQFLEDAKTVEENFTSVEYSETAVLQNKEILFPLPFNEEQINILNKIENSNSVIVLGPPGTGKSHTIANLVSHFLAKGQRVLVTSQKDQALDVLLNKIPAELRRFCIPILSSVSDGKQKMEEAFIGINNAIGYSDNFLKKEIKNINNSIDETKVEFLKTQEEIKLGCKAQLNKINYKNKTFLPLELIQELNIEAEKHSWLKDEVKYSTKEDCDGITSFDVVLPIKNNELERLIALKRELSAELRLLSQKRIPTELILDPVQFEGFVKNLLKLKELDNRLSKCIPDLIIKDVSIDKLTEFTKILKSKISFEQQIKYEWQNKLLQTISDETEYKRLFEQVTIILQLKQKIEDLYKKLNLFSEIKIESVLSLDELLTFFDTKLQQVKDGKNIYSFCNTLFLNNKEKEALNNLYIDKKHPKTKEEWEQVIIYLQFLALVEKLSTNWNKIAKRYNLPISNAKVSEIIINPKNSIYKYFFNEDEYKNTITLISGLNSIFKFRECEQDVKLWADEIFEDSKNIISKNETAKILQSIEYRLSKDNYESTKAKQEELNTILSNYLNNCKLNIRLFESFKNIYQDSKNALLDWNKAYNKLKELELLKDKYDEFINLLEKMKINAPIWAKYILEEDSSEYYPQYWINSFEYKAANDYINKINKIALNLNKLEDKLNSLSRKLRDLKVQLILNTAIKNIKSNITHEKLRALEEWQMALKKLGKGTGKFAAKRQRQLKESTQKAKGAIPVWIMPLYKISETIPSEIGIFDVVIVDEASQSDIRTFLSLMRGKKVIIVGDPKQVSPTNIGADEVLVQNKINEYLKDIPAGQFMDLKTSIYDIAKLTLGGNNVLMLKEHFRCLPEIIRFSNDLCYRGEIIPLRYEPPNKKLNPVLQSIYIQDGIRREQQDVNENEAVAVCETIQKIVNSEKYKGKTIGVISLTGNDQAKYIENILSKYITTDELIQFNIRIGDAATFQGDERDIIILSMVVGANDTKKYSALTADMYKQRFNVAVSRAKNKLILVHSIKLENIANPNCMRYKLLEFFNSGQIEDKKKRDKMFFDSKFEESVYNALTNKGYIITPQVKIGPYKIDLVVEGSNQRLGIECDGDKYHPPSKWFEDSLRQKHLERMGWNIYRIWGSDFYSRKNAIIDDITKKLNQMGIYPQTFKSQQSVDEINLEPNAENTSNVGLKHKQAIKI